MCKKESYVVSIVIVLAIAAVLFLPVMGTAGSLEPSAAPAPTMKTLDQIPPAWSKKLPSAQRFELVLDGAAVLDKETGLVWEQSPSEEGYYVWYEASKYCANKGLGGRKGWHLPTMEQLMSLVDASASWSPKLPNDFPYYFHLVEFEYWSANTATKISGSTDSAYYVYFGDGSVDSYNKANPLYVWCVRGGMSYDGY